MIILLARSQSAPPQAQLGYQAAPDAEQKKTLLLKDFHPVPILHAPVQYVERAKYYVIDLHNHTNDAMGIEEHMPPERVIQIMDKTNVHTVVILMGMWREKLEHVIDEMVKPYPGDSWFFRKSTSRRLTIPISARRWWRSWTTRFGAARAG